jgi:diacylglycerol O-acyltransferase
VNDGHPALELAPSISLSETRDPDAPPPRVLILSADMGEGHNAAAAAITEALSDIWPECQVERVDTWALWSQGFSRAAIWGYRVQMSWLPSTYEAIYRWLCRSTWFAAVFKAAVRRFFGRRLDEFLAAHPYDLIISTYPFGSAALDWIHERGRINVPTVTYIPAFHVHPVWTYSGIDRHYVMYDTASKHARTKGFAGTMRVGAPPVMQQFGSISKEDARRRLGLQGDAFTVLVTGGAWGLGGIPEAVAALLEGDPRIRILAVCGKRVKLAEDLEALGADGRRLRVLGYVENMHELMAAADIVVTNGAGVTVLEALRTPRPVISFRPLAGHGRASTAEMARRNLALVAHDAPSLVEVVSRLASDRILLARMEQAGRSWVEGRELRESVLEITRLVLNGSRRDARAEA